VAVAVAIAVAVGGAGADLTRAQTHGPLDAHHGLAVHVSGSFAYSRHDHTRDASAGSSSDESSSQDGRRSRGSDPLFGVAGDSTRDERGSHASSSGSPGDGQGGPGFVLAGLHLGVKAGELVVVVGGVGSGKSSLLLAALGELEPVPLPPRLGPTGRPLSDTSVESITVAGAGRVSWSEGTTAAYAPQVCRAWCPVLVPGVGVCVTATSLRDGRRRGSATLH